MIGPKENILWEKDLLGGHNLQALLNTLTFYIGLFFAICEGEHHMLRHNPSQIQLVESPGSVLYWGYTESVSTP